MFNSIFKAFSDMLRVSKIVSLKSWFHFGFEIKTKRGFSPSTYTTRKLTFEQLSSVLRKLWFSQVGSRLLETEVNSYQLSIIVTNSSTLDVDRGPDLVKLIFVWQKKPPKSIQKLFMMETVSTVIVKPYLLYQDPGSCYYIKLSFLRRYLDAFSCKLLSQNALS